MKKNLLRILPFLLLAAGCLPDNIDGPQIVFQPIYPPAQVYFRAVNVSDLQVRWNPSPSDIQENFKGYFIQLFRSAPYSPPSTDNIDSVFDPILYTDTVLKSDTSVIFKNITLGRYTVRVWGQHSSALDTLILSKYPQSLSFDFDPRPVSAPKQIFATSIGPTTVKLFWLKSISENQIGMVGYIIRFKDTTRSNGPLITVSPNKEKDTNFATKYISAVVTVPARPNSTIPEYPYKFWVKAIRQDSVESEDSIGISWSGAERIPGISLPVRLDTGIFMGIVGPTYNLVQTVPTGPSAQLLVTQSNGDVLVKALNGTKFVNRVDNDSSLDANFFAAPFLNSEFTETQLRFPASGNDKGAIIYALLPDKNRARILFQKDTSGGSYIRPGNTISIQASFQPIEPDQLPFF